MGPRSKRNSTKMVHVSATGNFDAVIALKNVPSQFEVTLVSSSSIQFNEREFDLGMAGKNWFLVRPRTEVGKQETVDKADSCVQQGRIACGAIIGNRALQQVPDVV